MKVSTLSTIGAILSLAALGSTQTARNCTEISIEVPVVARNAVFNLKAPENNIDVTNFILGLAQQGHNLTSEVLAGYTTINNTYQIAATYCEPHSGPSNTVQLLTHGIGFDRKYWDISINNYNYSYVAQAVSHGYSTFAWDRLGVAESQHGEAVDEIQSYLEIAALKSLTQLLRDGSIDGISSGFDKVVHVGHSFGSIQSYSLEVLYPGASDGLVLTGFSQTDSFISMLSLGADFVLANSLPGFSDYPNGYIIEGSATALQQNFFSSGGFDPELLNLAYNALGEPVTVGEMLTVSSASSIENPLTGPVLVITGEVDVPFCGGDCLLTGNASLPNFLELSRPMFPATRKFETVIVNGSGHGLNLEYSHPFTYSTILEFITQNVGL